MAEEGAEQVGRYRLIANWIAHVHLNGTRSPLQVARYIRLLVKEAHRRAVLKAQTVHPVPEGLVLSQNETSDTEEENDTDDNNDPGPEVL